MVHSSATKFLHSHLSSARVVTICWSRFSSLVSRAIVRLQVSMCLPTLLLPAGVQLIACFCSHSRSGAWLWQSPALGWTAWVPACHLVLLHCPTRNTLYAAGKYVPSSPTLLTWELVIVWSCKGCRKFRMFSTMMGDEHIQTPAWNRCSSVLTMYSIPHIHQ